MCCADIAVKLGHKDVSSLTPVTIAIEVSPSVSLTHTSAQWLDNCFLYFYVHPSCCLLYIFTHVSLLKYSAANLDLLSCQALEQIEGFLKEEDDMAIAGY